MFERQRRKSSVIFGGGFAWGMFAMALVIILASAVLAR